MGIEAYALVIELGFRPPAADPGGETFEAFLDCVLEQFDVLDVEVDLAASLAHHSAEFLVEVQAEDPESAAMKALTDLRTALHAADCVTAGWPTSRQGMSLRLLEREEDGTPDGRDLAPA